MQQEHRSPYLEDWDLFEDQPEAAEIDPPRAPAPASTRAAAPTDAPAARRPVADAGTLRASSEPTWLAQVDEDEPDAPLFPCWKLPEHFPAIFARSALFSAQRLARSKEDEPWFNGELRAAGARLLFDGPRLSMNDKEVFEELASLAKRKKLRLDQAMTVPVSALAASLGWKSRNEEALSWIADCARRLGEAHVVCQPKGQPRFEGRMLLEASRTARGLTVRFDPAFVEGAFGHGLQFKMDRERRRRLSRPLARWLHDFLATHTKRDAIDLGYLREISGYPQHAAGSPDERRQRREFPTLLAGACAQLRETAPKLAGPCELDKTGVNSSEWKATFPSGDEKPSYESAEKFATPKPASRRASL
jgi:hypothetical protein